MPAKIASVEEHICFNAWCRCSSSILTSTTVGARAIFWAMLVQNIECDLLFQLA